MRRTGRSTTPEGRPGPGPTPAAAREACEEAGAHGRPHGPCPGLHAHVKPEGQPCAVAVFAAHAREAPGRLPPEAEAVLRAIRWDARRGRNPPEHWFTTLVDAPREDRLDAEVRARIDRLRRRLRDARRVAEPEAARIVAGLWPGHAAVTAGPRGVGALAGPVRRP